MTVQAACLPTDVAYKVLCVLAGPAPLLGADTHAVMLDFGFEQREVEALRWSREVTLNPNHTVGLTLIINRLDLNPSPTLSISTSLNPNPNPKP